MAVESVEDGVGEMLLDMWCLVHGFAESLFAPRLAGTDGPVANHGGGISTGRRPSQSTLPRPEHHDSSLNR